MYGDWPMPHSLVHTSRVGQPTAAEQEEAAAYERKRWAGWEKVMGEPNPNVGHCWKCDVEVERGILCGDCSERIQGKTP